MAFLKQYDPLTKTMTTLVQIDGDEDRVTVKEEKPSTISNKNEIVIKIVIGLAITIISGIVLRFLPF